MADQSSSRYCRNCGKQVLAVRPEANHVLHLLITLFLCGLWIPVWIFLALFPGPWRCSQCGSKV